MDTLDCIVIGGGVIGLAIARQLSRQREVFVLEKNTHIGMETSSRNSGVIHAGLYYPQHFLKTQLCIKGRELLYDYCAEHSIPYQRCGKLIVASSSAEIPALKQLQHNANSLKLDTQWLNSKDVGKYEPALQVSAALLSPNTGSIDSGCYMASLHNDILRHGSQVLCHHEVCDIEVSRNGFIIHYISAGEKHKIQCRQLVNASGLHAISVSKRTLPETLTPQQHYYKGQYFQYTGQATFQHHIYPLPSANTAGLGIHLTCDIDGSLKFGPDVQYLANEIIDYSVDTYAKEKFLNAIQRYFPAITADELQPGFAGIRPKLTTPNSPAADFMISTPKQHGINNLIHCFGIESPGLTASLAIADYVDQHLWL